MGKKNRIRRQKSSDEEKPKCNPGDGGDKDEVDASTNNDRSSSNGEATGRKKDKRRGHQKLAKNNKKDQSSSDKEATLRKNDKDRGGGRRGTDKGKHMKAEKDGWSRRKGGDSPMDRPDQRSSDEEKPKCNPGDGGDKDEVDASTNNDRSSSNGEATGRKKDKRRGHQKLAKNNKKDQSSSDKEAELRKNDKDRGGGRRGTDKGKHMKAEKDGRSRRKGGDSPMDRPDQRASLDEESTIPQASPHRVPPSETVLALTGCKAAERTIQKLDITRMQMDVSVLHSFTLPANPTLQQIREFFAARLVYYQLKYPSSSIPGRLRNGICINIPVTPDKEAKLEDRCYHVVKFTRSTDLAVGQLLVEDYSCYVVAHRVIRCDEKEEDVPWNMIGDEDLPSRFKSPRRTKYGSHYISPSKIQIYVGTIDDIVSFLEEFKKKYNQVPTTEGKRYFDTIFVLVSEAFRFVVVGKWAERGLLSNVYVPIPTAFPSLLRDWLDLCKIIYLLYLALLEKALLGEEHPLFLATMNETVQKWKETQRQVLEARVIFFEEGVDLDLEQLYYLNGENILLLRYDEDLWKKISLRRIGYEGLWMEAINIKVLGS